MCQCSDMNMLDNGLNHTDFSGEKLETEIRNRTYLVGRICFNIGIYFAL